MSSSTPTLGGAQVPLPPTNGQSKETHRQDGAAKPFWEWTKLRKLALRRMDKFIELVPVVLRDEDLTAVNRMRVYCRRLEEVLDLIYVKPRPRHIKKLRRRLELCRRTLSELRNCDALLAAADNSIANRRLDGAAWQALREYLQSMRARTAARTLEKLGRVNLSVPYLRLKRDLSLGPDGAANCEHGNETELHPEATVIYARIIRSLERHWRDFTDTVEESHHDPCEHVIHRMRIAVKRLRYLAEVMDKLHIDGSIEALNWLKTLQRTIGTWHDLEIMERVLRDIVRGKTFHGDQMMAAQIDRVIRHNRETKKTSTQKFFQMTRHSREYLLVKQWIAQVIGMHRP